MLSRRQHQRLNWRLRLATPAANLQQIVFLWLNIYQTFVARGLPHWYGRSPHRLRYLRYEFGNSRVVIIAMKHAFAPAL